MQDGKGSKDWAAIAALVPSRMKKAVLEQMESYLGYQP
jgi:hypothetical protein